MSNQTEKYTKFLKKAIEERELILSKEIEYSSWVDQTLSVLYSIFGEKSYQIKKFEETTNTLYVYFDGNSDSVYANYSKKGVDFLNNIIEQIEEGLISFDKHDKPTLKYAHAPVNVFQNQSQFQEQSQQVNVHNIIEIIQEDLNESQKRELKTLLEEFKSKKNNFRVVDKLKKFFVGLGEGVIVDLCVALLTNPGLIDGLISGL